MHPDDVADLVASDVDDLRVAVQRLPEDLPIGDVILRDCFHVEVSVPVRRLRSENIQMRSRLLVRGRPLTKTVAIPILGRGDYRTLVVHADCTDFDGLPPLIDLLDANRRPLAADAWPRDEHSRGIVTSHPKYHRPFFCRPGTREFHDHPQHEDQPWDRIREEMSLSGLLLSVLRDLHHRFVL